MTRGVKNIVGSLGSRLVSGSQHEFWDQLSWKWRQIRHVFGDTFLCRALPPVI